MADNMIGGHACLHTEFIHGGDIPFPTEHKLSRLTTPPIEYMLNGYDDSALNGVAYYETGIILFGSNSYYVTVFKFSCVGKISYSMTK